MFIDFLTRIFRNADQKVALIHHDAPFTYAQLLIAIDEKQIWLREQGVAVSKVVLLEADYSPQTVATFLALIEAGAIIIPITTSAPALRDEMIRIGQVQWICRIEGDSPPTLQRLDATAEHELYQTLRQRGHPGLVLFSSGSSGKPKGTVHDLVKLLGKYQRQRQDLRTLAFLLFDHIGGLDTLFYCLSNGSTIVLPTGRTPEQICQAIETHRVEVLPTAPTFLSMLVLSDLHQRFDLSSVKYVTYGAEVMPEQTLRRCKEIFPHATMLQKYGTTEIGTMRSKSRSDESLWVKLGGEGFQWRAVDGMLQIKADSAMLGYLNAPSPFTSDGWFMTGDCIEVDGEFVRILGRKSDIINVGGQKVYPAEVETVIRQMDNVTDATVHGEPHLLTGNIVVAKVSLAAPEEPATFRLRLKKHVGAALEPYKVPVKIIIQDQMEVSSRFKKVRRQDPSP